MVYYKGSISYETFENMPIDKILDLNEQANRIESMIKQRTKKHGF